MTAFVQISAATGGTGISVLYALDDRGRVWYWYAAKQTWQLLPDPRREDV